MNIIKMSEQHLAGVCRLEEEIFSKPWSKESFLNALRNENNIYLVAIEGQDILGYSGLWGIPPEGEICNMAVCSGKREKGIGKKILFELIENAKMKKIERFTLEVRKSNVAATNLYQSIGFKQVGLRRNYYTKPTEDGIIMGLQYITTRQEGNAVL